MMTASDSIDVRHVAKLARLNLTDNEITQFQKQLGAVLGYMEKLAELKVDSVEATSHPYPLSNVFRDDTPVPPCDPDMYLKNAPEVRDGQFAVPKIIE